MHPLSSRRLLFRCWIRLPSHRNVSAKTTLQNVGDVANTQKTCGKNQKETFNLYAVTLSLPMSRNMKRTEQMQSKRKNRKRRKIKNSLVEIDDITIGPGHEFSAWTEVARGKLKVFLAVFIQSTPLGYPLCSPFTKWGQWHLTLLDLIWTQTRQTVLFASWTQKRNEKPD